jgi:hypothetical protein
MTRSAPLITRRTAAFALLALATYVTASTLVTSNAFARRPALGEMAITFDLLVFVPFVWWLVVVRGGQASLRTLVPVILVSLAGARLVLPREQQSMLPWVRWLVAPAEVAVVAWVAWQIRQLIRRRRASGGLPRTSGQGHDLLADLSVVLAPAFGTGVVARTVTTEIALLYYAFASWGRPAHVPVGSQRVALELNGSLLIGLGMALAVETVALHLFLTSRWGPVAAWVLTATSVYSLIWLVGEFRARALRPPYVTDEAIVMRNGMRADAIVPRAQLAAVERVTWRTLPAKGRDYLDLSRPGEPNVVLHFREPVEVALLFGRRRKVSRVGLRAERPDDALRALSPR